MAGASPVSVMYGNGDGGMLAVLSRTSQGIEGSRRLPEQCVNCAQEHLGGL